MTLTTTPHLFTVDVEEYFQVTALAGSVPREEWDVLPRRVGASVDLLLGLLDRHEALATFFVLGWVAERDPALVRRIASAGHEVASHGWSHRPVTRLTPQEFRREVRASKELLEELSGRPVMGYRAPSFSITPGREWAFDVLLEEGYAYDSSLFPIRRREYGYPGCEPVPHRIQRSEGSILELPMVTTVIGGIRLPAAGGAYFRQLPYALTRRAFREQSARGNSAVFYIHPWELDPDQPRLNAPLMARLRHYRGLERTRRRLERLLSEFRFTSIEERYALGVGRPVETPAGALSLETPARASPA